MGNSRYEAVVAFLLQVDRDILFYILPIDFFFSVAVVAIFARNRRPLELLSLFFICFAVLFAAATFVFHVIFERPFALLEVYSFP